MLSPNQNIFTSSHGVEKNLNSRLEKRKKQTKNTSNVASPKTPKWVRIKDISQKLRKLQKTHQVQPQCELTAQILSISSKKEHIRRLTMQNLGQPPRVIDETLGKQFRAPESLRL